MKDRRSNMKNGKKSGFKNDQKAVREEKIRVDGEIKRRENKYYLRISDRYRTAGFLLLLVFVVFSGVMMLRYNEYITYDNFVYLIRDFESISGGDDESRDKISLDIADGDIIEPFRDGFATATGEKVTLYDRTGVELVSESESFSYPALVGSEKYLIAYDIGGTSYSVYNSVTRVVARHTEFPIISASVSDEGSYIITTESDEAKYVTEVYNTALTRTMSIYKDKYVTACAISDDGDYVALASLMESGADFACEISFYKVGQSEAVKTQTYNMAMPLILEGMDGGNFVLLCDDAVRFFTSEGELISNTASVGGGVSGFDADSDGVILVCRENAIGSENRVYTFDNEGNILYNNLVPYRVSGAAVSRRNDGFEGYLVISDGVIALNGDGDVLRETDDGVICVVDTESGPYACMTGRAIRLDFSEESK